MKSANGYQRGADSDLRRIVISMDTETFAEVRGRARKAGHSFAEEARILIEMGLETMKMEQAA